MGTFSIGRMSPAEPAARSVSDRLRTEAIHPEVPVYILSKKTVNLLSWRDWEMPTLSETTD
jgi:hypothetical protein